MSNEIRQHPKALANIATTAHRLADTRSVSPPTEVNRHAAPMPTELASDYSPSDPVLRANPCSEVTDPSCRLPLPTLFSAPEAIHLGDLLRISVRPATKIIPSRSDFQGPTKVFRTPHEPRCFTGALSLSLDNPIPGTVLLNKEKKTLPRTSADVSEVDCVTAWGQADHC